MTDDPIDLQTDDDSSGSSPPSRPSRDLGDALGHAATIVKAATESAKRVPRRDRVFFVIAVLGVVAFALSVSVIVLSDFTGLKLAGLITVAAVFAGITIMAFTRSGRTKAQPMHVTQITQSINAKGTSQWAAVEQTSAIEFLAALEASPLVVFFDVRTRLGDTPADTRSWFDAHMQVHLALQDSTTRFSQMSYLVDLLQHIDTGTDSHDRPKFPPYLGSPAVRVLFVEEETAEFASLLRDAHNSRKGKYRDLPELMMIHWMMGCPLAVVCLDKLVEIIKEAVDSAYNGHCETDCFLTNRRCRQTLRFNGFDPNDLRGGDKARKKSVNQLRNDLVKMRRAERASRPVIVPSLDFAMLMDQGAERFSRAWGGVLYEDTAAGGTRHTKNLYYEINENLINSDKLPVSAKTSISVRLPLGCKDDLLGFGALVFKKVFVPNDPDSSGQELADYGPAVRALKRVTKLPQGALLHVNADYDPRQIMMPKVR